MPLARFAIAFVVASTIVSSTAPVSAADGAASDDQPLSTIAFGSCAKQDKPQPIWDAVVGVKPELFIFLGDNIYGDSEDMAVLKQKWDMLAAKSGYQKLKDVCPIIGTWDDHDYGKNDAGVEYPKKQESQQLFLDFLGEPDDSPRRMREGVYDAKIYGPEGKRVQVILLDTRYHRSPLTPGKRGDEPGDGVHGPYQADLDPASTVLGEPQWKWLEEQFKKPAELRIVASSIQVVPDKHWWEKWGNFPLQRQRLFELIRNTRANGVVFISGDRHHSEISKIDVGYPVFDVTASSLNQPGKWRNEINPHRVGVIYPEENFGTIKIDWSAPDPVVRLQIRDIKGKPVLQAKTSVGASRPPVR